MIHYLLDTNAVIGLMNDPRSLLAKRLRRKDTEQIAISAIILSELYFGAYKSARVENNLGRIADLQFTVLALNEDDAHHAGEIRAVLQRAGSPIGHYDVLIAGQARARKMTLVTHNTREFARVPGLKIEDWEA